MKEVKSPVKVFCGLRRLSLEQGQWSQVCRISGRLQPYPVSPVSTLLRVKRPKSRVLPSSVEEEGEGLLESWEPQEETESYRESANEQGHWGSGNQ